MKNKRDLQQERGMYLGGWILLALLAVIAGAVKFFHAEVSMLPCIVNRLTGYYCPGCGGTRAVRALFHGELLKSVCAHPVVLYAAALYGWFMISNTVFYASKGKINIGMRYSDKYLYIALVIILVQWVIKNLLKAVWGISLI